MTTHFFFKSTPTRKGTFAGCLLLALALLHLIVLNGCATVGHDFPESQVAAIKTGKTTMAEIRMMFGDPWRTGIEDGQRTWTYGRYHYTVTGRKDARDLVVRFDDRDTVASYSYNATEPGK